MELTDLKLLTTPADPGDYFHAGHKVPVHLTARQKAYCRRAVGAARFTYNLCVETHRFHRTNRLKWPTISQMANCITQMKKEEFSFLSEISFRVTDGAIANFKNALNKWLDPDDPAQKPSIHRRKRTGTGSFRAAGAVREIHYNGKRRIKLPYLGSVKLNHTLPKGIIHEAHISRQNGKWILSVNYRKDPIPKPKPDQRTEKGAADSGISPSATDSEGQVWLNPKAFYQAERKLARWQRAQARRKKGSRGWWEAQRKIDKLQRRVTNIRSNAIHQMTKDLVTKFQHLVIEDLNVAGMMKGITPKVQADAAMGEIKRQLSYKGQWHHCQVYLANRFYPSSKTCSFCQEVNSKLKRETFWQCPSCGMEHERNLNAAANLLSLLALLPSAGGTLRDGKALAPGQKAEGETSPETRTKGPEDWRTAPLPQRAPQTVGR